jgi:two-component system CheB/CheR fusion protein
VLGVSVSFIDVTRSQALRGELEDQRRQLETAYEELQSTVEELETTNEELRSANEELETTNEELQSTNEELETMNDELRERTDEALSSNTHLAGILSSIPQSVVVVDSKLRVSAWSAKASELWGLRADEVSGEHVLDLEIGVPMHSLREPIREALAGEQPEPVTLSGHDRRGNSIECSVTFAPLNGRDGSVSGVVLVMEAARI